MQALTDAFNPNIMIPLCFVMDHNEEGWASEVVSLLLTQMNGIWGHLSSVLWIMLQHALDVSTPELWELCYWDYRAFPIHYSVHELRIYCDWGAFSTIMAWDGGVRCSVQDSSVFTTL